MMWKSQSSREDGRARPGVVESSVAARILKRAACWVGGLVIALQAADVLAAPCPTPLWTIGPEAGEGVYVCQGDLSAPPVDSQCDDAKQIDHAINDPQIAGEAYAAPRIVTIKPASNGKACALHVPYIPPPPAVPTPLTKTCAAGTNCGTTIAVTFRDPASTLVPEPDMSYRVVVTAVGATGTVPAGARRVVAITKDPGAVAGTSNGFTINLEAALTAPAGGPSSVTYDWVVLRDPV